MSKSIKIPIRLLKKLYKFFWDVDPKEINPRKSSHYVINRLLDKGDLEAARWVLKNFPKEIIIETIKKKRDFSYDTVNFWAHYFHIPKKEIACIQEPYRSLRKMHWPY